MNGEQRPLAVLWDLIVRYGRETTSFQTVEPGLSYWFDPDSDACVAYVDTGRAWVSVGPPLAALEHEDEVAFGFVEAAARHNRRACFFAVERSEFGGLGMQRLHLGEQPYWDPQRWAQVLKRKRSLREQLRRARAKQVVVRRIAASELTNRDSSTRQAIDTLVACWIDGREMAPMGFVVQIDLDTLVEERCVFVAEQDQRVIGVLAAVPIPAICDTVDMGDIGHPSESTAGWFSRMLCAIPTPPTARLSCSSITGCVIWVSLAAIM